MTSDITQPPKKASPETEGEEWIIPEALAGLRLDKALTQLRPDTSRSQLQQWMEAGYVLDSHGICTHPSRKVKEGECYWITPPEPLASELIPWQTDLDICYEDDDLLVINKPAGMVVHPAAGHQDKTLVHALLAHCGDSLSGIGGVLRPGIVHRLDKDTSGLMLVAKHDKAHQALAAQLADRSLSREYQALVWGVPLPPVGRIDVPIGRHPSQRKKMAVREDGKEASTQYRVLTTLAEGACSHIRCTLETGRTHQIRVHLTHRHHPLIGDPVYGNRRKAPSSLPVNTREALHCFSRQALHAGQIGFIHPGSEEKMAFSSPLPEDMQELLDTLRAI